LGVLAYSSFVTIWSMDGVWQPNPEKLSIVHDEIMRLTKLIKDLSDLTIMESDEIKLDKNVINLLLLLNNVVEELKKKQFGNKWYILQKKEIKDIV